MKKIEYFLIETVMVESMQTVLFFKQDQQFLLVQCPQQTILIEVNELN